MTTFEKFQPLFLLLSLVLGLVLSQFDWLSLNGQKIVVPSLSLMLTIVFLSIRLQNLGKTFSNYRFRALGLSINFLWTPLFAWLLGIIFLKGHPDLRIGFFMLLVTPCTDWYLVFTQLAGGKTSLAATLLPWHLLLQLFLLPLFLFIFLGKLVPIEWHVFVESIAFMLLIPFMISIFVRHLAVRFGHQDWLESKMIPAILPAQFIFLCLAISAIFASQGEAIIAHPEFTLLLFPPLLVFYIFNLVLSKKLSRIARLDERSSIGLIFSTIARNSPLALAIALTAFPDRPYIALVLVIGPLIEFPLMALFAKLLKVKSEKIAKA